MRKRTITLVLTLLVVLLLIFVRRYAGQFLVVNQSPQSSDVIIVLSGNPEEELILRLEHACFLYQLQYAPHLIVSGDSYISGAMRDYVVKKGIPREAVLVDENAYSTYENALYTKNLMVSHGFKSAIIVSSEYHMRRTKFLFDNIYKGTGITLVYCATKSSFFNRQKWWDNKQSAEVTMNEYLKLIANALGIYSQDNNDKAILNNLNKYLFLK